MSFYVFSGSDRVKIGEKVKKILGKDYEIFDGADLTATALMEICRGATLFATKRKILIKDLTAMKEGEPYEILLKYADTQHEIVIWEQTLSQKKTFKDFCKLEAVQKEKIDVAKKEDPFAIFKIFDLALRDGERALREYQKMTSDPYRAVGALATWSLNKYKFKSGEREKRIMKAVAELDMQTKTLKITPELLVESFILRLSAI